MKHILVFIHGITLETIPVDHTEAYEVLLGNMELAQPGLVKSFSDMIFVEYGHEVPGGAALRPDQKIGKAQAFSHQSFKIENVKQIKDFNNKTRKDWSWIFPLRGLFKSVRELFVVGIADAMYYGSEDGEAAIRRAVYGQVLHRLHQYEDYDVTLHVISHSLGCTVAFDFLYGLFAPKENWKGKKPDFSKDKIFGRKYMKWRKKREAGELHFGSLNTMASQLPVTLLRKQKVVDLLSAGMKLDATSIGIDGDRLQWKVYYDIDDMLAYPTRNIFLHDKAIMDIQVDTADLPHNAHTNYWYNKDVAKECAELIWSSVGKE